MYMNEDMQIDKILEYNVGKLRFETGMDFYNYLANDLGYSDHARVTCTEMINNIFDKHQNEPDIKHVMDNLVFNIWGESVEFDAYEIHSIDYDRNLITFYVQVVQT